jgi:hypothetical protein
VPSSDIAQLEMNGAKSAQIFVLYGVQHVGSWFWQGLPELNSSEALFSLNPLP